MEHLDYSLEETIRWWDDVDEKGTNKAGIRALCRIDRFYLLVKACRRHDMLHPWLYTRCRMVEKAPNGYMDLWAREHYKDLADSTPMLTENRGWTTHGELKPGDFVFAPNGKPVQVLAVTQQYTDSECYKLIFAGGAEIIAGAGHLWKLRKKHKLRISGSEQRRISFADEIVQTNLLSTISRVDVGNCAPLEYCVQQLLIHPYVLGAWLGNGSKVDGRVAGIDLEIFEKIKELGYKISEHTGDSATVYGLRPLLRELGVLGCKHVPRQYMQASIHQRLELLRGLMDTDGHCNTRGSATFINTNELLVDAVFELATGLGLKPIKRKYAFASTAQKAVDGLYWYWQVNFQAHTDMNPFYLPRKAERAKPPSHYDGVRILKSIEPVPSVPTRCIQVEGGMYVAGKELVPTHNSTIVTFGGAIQRILNDPNVTIGIFSHTNPIASAFLRQIKTELETNITLKAVFPDILYENPTKDAQRWSVDGGIVVRRTNNSKEATVEASGLVDGQPVSKHYRIRIYDDIVTDKSVGTPEQSQKTTDAYSLSQSLGVQGGEEWMVGTRYNYADTYEWIIKRDAMKVRMFPATDTGLRDGKPVFFSQDEWNSRLRKNTDNDIACQYLQNPLSGQQKMFDIQDLQIYEARPETLNVYIMCDPARSKKKESANTAIIVIGMDYAMNKYLLDGMNHKMDLKERWENFAGMYARWSRMPGVQMVKMGYESFGAQADMDYFQEQMRRPDSIKFPIEELAWPRDGEGSKIDRVQRLVPDLRSHKIFLPFDTDPKHLTKFQQQMASSGYDYRIARTIRRKDEQGQAYDVAEQLKMQFHYFPFGGLKDAIDAFARIYDLEPRAPRSNEPGYAEPEFC